MSEYQEPSELKKAEPWLRQKAERVFQLFEIPEDCYDDEGQEQIIDKILFQLKVAYSEGYADRMKSEVAELRSETPKRRLRRKK